MILPCSILFCMHVLRSKNGQREQSALLQPHTQSIERILELNANVIAMDHRHRWCCECSSAGNARTTYSFLAKNIALEGSKSCACNWKSLSLGKKFIWADNTHIFEHNEDSLRIFFFSVGNRLNLWMTRHCTYATASMRNRDRLGVCSVH